jgi:hypothetical protein
LLSVVVALGLITSACGSPAAREPTSRVASPSKSSEKATHLSHGGCSIELPGAWRSLPAAASSAFEQAEREDGAQSVSILGAAIPKPGPADEWREDLSAIVDLRREREHEAFGPDARFSSPEYRPHPSTPSAFYTVYDPEQRALQATLIKMVTSRFCIALSSEEGAEEAELSARAKAARRSASARRLFSAPRRAGLAHQDVGLARQANFAPRRAHPFRGSQPMRAPMCG